MTAVLKVIEGGTAQRRSSIALPEYQRGSTWAPARDAFLDDWLQQSISKEVQLWTDAVLRSAAATYLANSAPASSLNARRLWSNQLPECVDRLGRMVDGWAGEDSKAPSEKAISDIQKFTPMLPLSTRIPDVEVDPSDGEIKLAWRSASQPRSFAIAFSGDGFARLLQSNLEQPVAVPMVEFSLEGERRTDIAIALTMLENFELVESE